MKEAVLLICLFLAGSNFDSRNDQCENFKTGEFIYFDQERDEFNEKIITIRTTDMQTLIDHERGDTLVYDLTWTSDCKYQLILAKSNLQTAGPVKIGDTLTVSIQPIDNTTFKYSSKVNKPDFDGEFKGIMKKIR